MQSSVCWVVCVVGCVGSLVVNLVGECVEVAGVLASEPTSKVVGLRLGTARGKVGGMGGLESASSSVCPEPESGRLWSSC